MEGIKHSRQFAETESLMDNYFVCHIVPVMKQTQAYLNEKQGEEMTDYSTSIGGILSMMATAGQPLGDPLPDPQSHGRMELENHPGIHQDVPGDIV
jgi:hypothetical protein